MYAIGFELEAIGASSEISDIQIKNVCDEIILISELNIGFELKPSNIITHHDIADYKPTMEKVRERVLNRLFAPKINYLREVERDFQTGKFWFIKDNKKQEIKTVNGLLTVISREHGVKNLPTGHFENIPTTDKFF